MRLKRQDLRFLKLPAEAYECWYDGRFKLIIKAPSMPYDFLHNAKGEDAGMKASEYEDPRILEAYNVTRNDIVNDKERHYVYYILDFSSATSIALDNEIFSPQAENGLVTVDVHPIVTGTVVDPTTGNKKPVSDSADIVWNIAISEPYPRYVTAAKPKGNALTEKLTKSMGGLSFDDSD